MALRLRLRRKPDPVLTDEELHIIRSLLGDHITWAKSKMNSGRVSESVIRSRMTAESALPKIQEALKGTFYDRNSK